MPIVQRLLRAAFVTIACASTAVAQTPAPSPSPTGMTIEAMIEAQLRIAERPETAQRIATFKRALYEALLKKGFTGDQAMQITIATSPPSAWPSR